MGLEAGNPQKLYANYVYRRFSREGVPVHLGARESVDQPAFLLSQD